MIVEFYLDILGENRWLIKTRNGRLVAYSARGYETHRQCVAAWRKMQKELDFTDRHIRYKYVG